MRVSRGALAWGLTLIVLGVLLFAQNQGLIRVDIPIWAWIIGGAGVLFLFSALTSPLTLWGLFFPGFILLGLGVVIFLSTSTRTSSNAIGSIFLAGIALPFWVVALLRRSHWWAIIPAGSVTVLAIMPLLAESRLSGQVVGAIFFLGLGATFGLVRLWTMGSSRMSWAWYPAVVLALIGLFVLAAGDPQVWPVALIGAGVLLLARAVFPARKPADSKEPDVKG